jgi:hypothetical protein
MMLIAILTLAQIQSTTPTAPTRYKVESKTVLDQDLTTLGRGKVTGSMTTTAYISVTTADSADGQVSRIVVDSMTLEPTGAMAKQITPVAAAAAADSARGLWVHAFSVRGTLRGVPQPSAPNPALASVMQATGVLFPGIRSGIKVGDKWADTTKIDGDVASGHQLGSIIASWTVTGIEEGGMVLDGTAVTAVVTTNTQTGGTLTVNGSSREHLAMAARGPSRNASIESVRDANTVQRPGAAPIPEKTVALLKLTRIP